MQPIQDLLHRIQWDQTFAGADFEIGYYDRIGYRIVRVPFSALYFPKDNHFAFELYEGSGEFRRVPFHRVREIYRDGRCIWRRGVVSIGWKGKARMAESQTCPRRLWRR